MNILFIKLVCRPASTEVSERDGASSSYYWEKNNNDTVASCVKMSNKVRQTTDEGKNYFLIFLFVIFQLYSKVKAPVLYMSA